MNKKDKNNGHISSNPLRDTLYSCRVMLKYVLLFGFISNILMLATPLYSMQVLDRVISSGNTNTLLMLSLIIAVALGLLSFIQIARSFAMVYMGAWIEKKLSEKVFENSIRYALQSPEAGGSVQMRDLQTLKTYLTSPQIVTMMDAPWAIIFIIVLFILHPAFGAIALLGSLFLLGSGVVTDRLTKPLLDANNENFLRSMNSVEQAAKNAEVINVMWLLPNILRKWQKLNVKVQDTQALSTKRQSILNEFTGFFRTIIQISVTGIGAVLVIKGAITPGVIIASSSLVGRALLPFQSAIASWQGFVRFQKSFVRLDTAFNHYREQEGTMVLPTPRGKITIENLYYSPPRTNKHIIRGVTFELDPGETLTIFGPSGSGKTTLAKLVVGALFPVSGSVRIDGAKLTDWAPEQLGKHIGYLPQDIELFSGTIKENIARMEEKPDPELVIIAAQLAGVHEMILQLPKGYDTDIGASGSSLSGGQRQRIGLARAFYGEPKVLVLDEPNSNLDTIGEEALSLAIEIAKEQRITTIVISHRTNLMNLADKIMVLKEGTIATFGTKKDVLEQLNKLKSVNTAAS